MRLFLIITIISLIFSACTNPGSLRREMEKPSIRRQNNQPTRGLNIVYGKASYYGADFHGRKTASGEVYDMNDLTAAHKEFPFGTLCRVTNLMNSKAVVVRINDRGPFVEDRIIDLSYSAAKELDAVISGVIDVKIEVLKYGEENN
jgi:rare lipoprotein A